MNIIQRNSQNDYVAPITTMEMVQFQIRQIGREEHKKEELKTSKGTHSFGEYLMFRGDGRGYGWG